MKYLITILKIFIFIVIIWFLIDNINFKELVLSLKTISIPLLLFVIFTIFLQVAVLAYRWQYISKFYNKWLDSFNACMITALFNTILPARLGEMSRVFYLKIQTGLAIKKSFIYLVIERFFDFLILLGMLLIVTFIESNASIWQNGAIISFLSLVVFLFIIKSKSKIFYKIFYNLKYKKLKKSLFKLHYLLSSRLNFNSMLYIIFLTIIIYLVNLGSLWLFLNYEMNFNLTFTQLFIVFTIISIGFVIPLNPGGVGTYHAAMVLALSFYNIPKEEALIAAIIMHLIQVLPSSIWGLSTILIQKIEFKKLKANN